eukprot:891887-Pyramimonas_sp.AAC.1
MHLLVPLHCRRLCAYREPHLRGAMTDGSCPPANPPQLASVPRMNAEAFSKLFNESVQDVLLVMYLANMTRTQLILADKLSIGAV